MVLVGLIAIVSALSLTQCGLMPGKREQLLIIESYFYSCQMEFDSCQTDVFLDYYSLSDKK